MAFEPRYGTGRLAGSGRVHRGDALTAGALGGPAGESGSETYPIACILISLLILSVVNNKHRKTLGKVFADPVNGAIE